MYAWCQSLFGASEPFWLNLEHLQILNGWWVENLMHSNQGDHDNGEQNDQPIPTVPCHHEEMLKSKKDCRTSTGRPCIRWHWQRKKLKPKAIASFASWGGQIVTPFEVAKASDDLVEFVMENRSKSPPDFDWYHSLKMFMNNKDQQGIWF